MPAEILKINPVLPEAQLITYTADQLRAGRVVGMPTDTFYGLAADPFNLHAVMSIYEMKERAKHKPLSLLVESQKQAESLGRDLPDEFYKLADRFWPGPLTMIVKAASPLPLRVTANTGNVALRFPAAEIPVSVIRAVGFPITATSANLLGASECTTAHEVHFQLGNELPLIVDGGTARVSQLSTIVDLSGDGENWYILREGAIPASDIEEALQS